MPLTAWTTFQGNARHTGYAPLETDVSKFVTTWDVAVKPGVALNPVVEDGDQIYVSTNAYFGTGTQVLFGINRTNGSTLWSYDFGAIHGVHSPACANGKVYVTTSGHSDSYLWVFDGATGAFQFHSPYGNQWDRYYSPTIVDGSVYMAGGFYGGCYAFNATTGEQKWFSAVNQYDQWTPAVDGGLVYVYTGSYAPAVTAFNASSGTTAFSIPDPGFSWSGWSMNLAPVVSGQTMFAIQGNRLLSFDLANKKIGWQLTGTFVGQVSLANNVLYLVHNGQLEARQASDGGFLWAWVPNSGTPSGPMIVTDHHVFVSTTTATYAVDLTSHQTAWTYAKGGSLALSKNASLLISAQDGTLASIALR